MPFVFKGTTVKKLTHRGTACKKHIAKGVQVWSANSDTYTVTASSSTDGVEVSSSRITNAENYTKMVIESANVSGGDYGANRGWLYCNGKCLYDTGDIDLWEFHTAVSSWGGTYDISQNGQVYVKIYRDRDENRDDGHSTLSVTVKFHFE